MSDPSFVILFIFSFVGESRHQKVNVKSSPPPCSIGKLNGVTFLVVGWFHRPLDEKIVSVLSSHVFL